MELRIEPFSFPEVINFNFDELKKELAEKVEFYKTLVYTDKDIKSAKTDVANLRKLIKAMSDERIRIKKQCLQPYDLFEEKVNQLTAIVNEPITLISEQIKTYEEQQKQEKKQKVEELYAAFPTVEWLKLSQIWNDKWLNASASMKSIEIEIMERIESIKKDLSTLSDLPEFTFEAMETYKSTLDINRAIAEGHRLSEMQKRKAEQERIKAEQEKARAERERLQKEQEEQRQAQLRQEYEKEVCRQEEIAKQHPNRPVTTVKPDPKMKQWVSFSALLNIEDARALAEFFKSRNIEFERI